MEITFDKETGIKYFFSPDYNYVFNSKNGYFARWGKTKEDDPKVGALEILDLEISEICEGIPRPGETVAIPCLHCYKTNSKAGRNMSFETFKDILDKLPKSLYSIAFGIGDIDANPDFVKMLQYCRDNNVVPNVTINGYRLTDEWVKTLSKYCGGVAVSRYENKDVCYDAVKRLTDAGISQVNLHMVLANENIDQCYKVIDEVSTDTRLSSLKAIVFLTLKPKGKRNKWTTVKDVKVYRDLVTYAMSLKVGLGFDSCSSPIFLAAMKDHENFKAFEMMAESCESDRFSGYVNVEGIWSHCSFTEGLPNWGTVDLKTITNFDSEVWNSPEVTKFRSCLTCQDNSHIGKDVFLCPVYNLYSEEIGRAESAVVESDRKIIEIFKEK